VESNPGRSPGTVGTVSGVDDGLVDRLAATRTIEITTLGRRSGQPVRIEIWWLHVENRFIITGTPGRRGWLANLRAEPQMTVHALGQDLPANARLVTDRAFRRRFFTQPNAEVDWYLSQSSLDELVDTAPMIEVLLAP
jgi:deazaflavin-dependent oxidoreductase (nitroreductase family)